MIVEEKDLQKQVRIQPPSESDLKLIDETVSRCDLARIRDFSGSHGLAPSLIAAAFIQAFGRCVESTKDLYDTYISPLGDDRHARKALSLCVALMYEKPEAVRDRDSDSVKGVLVGFAKDASASLREMPAGDEDAQAVFVVNEFLSRVGELPFKEKPRAVAFRDRVQAKVSRVGGVMLWNPEDVTLRGGRYLSVVEDEESDGGVRFGSRVGVYRGAYDENRILEQLNRGQISRTDLACFGNALPLRQVSTLDKLASDDSGRRVKLIAELMDVLPDEKVVGVFNRYQQLDRPQDIVQIAEEMNPRKSVIVLDDWLNSSGRREAGNAVGFCRYVAENYGGRMRRTLERDLSMESHQLLRQSGVAL